jgi:hypothetical protein
MEKLAIDNWKLRKNRQKEHFTDALYQDIC